MAEDYKKMIEEVRQVNLLLEQQKTLALALGNMEHARALQNEINANKQKLITELRGKEKELTKEQLEYLKHIEKTEKGIGSEVEKTNKWRRRSVDIGREVVNQLKSGWNYLQQQDKIIKSTILSLGLSGTKAELLRQSFEQSAGYVARLGGDLQDVQNIIGGFADETGRARVLSSQMIQDVVAIGKGTGLGVEQATRLAAQFEFMGLDARATMEYVQGVVDTSERMGVNTTKVLKSVSDNFKKLSTFTFQQGVKAFGKMAADAEKTRVSMATALNVAEATRGLESVIDLAANLQVMGGEFAKMDPLAWLYTVRNEPEKINEQLSKMTAGIYTLRRNSEGVFEKFISPADRDRLSSVAKSLGIAQEEMFEIAQRRLDLSLMEKEMAGLGLSSREKELIQGAAIFNTETGKFQVRLAGQMRDISTLTKEQANSFSKEQKSLEARAREALTFDETFKATINELKATLLPILNSVNKLLVWTRTNIFEPITKLSKTMGAWGTGAGLIAAAVIWKGVIGLMNNSISNFVNKISGGAGGYADVIRTKTGKVNVGATNAYNLGQTNRAKAFGTKSLKGGLGVGAAGLGVGAGVGAASLGVAEMAKAFKELTPEQINKLNQSLLIISGTMVAMGLVGVVAAKGLGVVALAALGIGAGIGIAAAGIGYMAKELTSLVSAGGQAGPAMLQIGAGIGAMSLAMMGFQVGLGGMLAFRGLLGSIAKRADDLDKVGNAFGNIAAVLSGNREDFIAVQNAVESISKMNVKGGGVLSELIQLMKQPLKVEFANGNQSFVSDVTLEIDGEKFMRKIVKANPIVQKIDSGRRGISE